MINQTYLVTGVLLAVLLVGLWWIYRHGFEGFTDDRLVRYGDLTLWWTWNHGFIKIDDTQVSLLTGYSEPSQIPRTQNLDAYIVIEDPSEIASGFASNSGPIKYGSPICLRSVKSSIGQGYISVLNSGIGISGSRGVNAQFEVVSSTPGTPAGSSVKYGDNVYLRSVGNKGIYLTIEDGGRLATSSVQDTKSMLTVVDRYGQGQTIDWARRGSAQQSSTYGGYLPIRAIDGNLGDFSHTQSEQGAWWQVTLPRDIHITTIEVVNRKDCCKERLNNYTVSVIDSNGQVTASKKYGVAGDGSTWTGVNSTGRVVKVQLQGTNFLHLAKVSVYGEPVISGTNEKPVSSTLISSAQNYSESKSTTYLQSDLPNLSSSPNLSLGFHLKLNARVGTLSGPGGPTGALSSKYGILSKLGDTGGPCPLIYLNSSGHLGINIGNQYFATPTMIDVGQWYYIVVIVSSGLGHGWTQTTDSQGHLVYVDNISKRYYLVNQSGSSSASSAPGTTGGSPTVPDLSSYKSLGTINQSETVPHTKIYVNGQVVGTYSISEQVPFNQGNLIVGANQRLSLSNPNFTIDRLNYYNYYLPESLISREFKDRAQTSGIIKRLVTTMPNALNPTTIPSESLPPLDHEITISFWMFSGRQVDGHYIPVFKKGGPGGMPHDRRPTMWFRPENNSLAVKMMTDNPSATIGEGIGASKTQITAGTWTHIGVTIKSGVMNLYINGSLDSSQKLVGTPQFSSDPLEIGGFPGEIQNFQMTNYGMTLNEILQIRGPHPDQAHLQQLDDLWKTVGCLTDPSKVNGQWISMLKSGQTGVVESQMKDYVNRAKSGDSQAKSVCYGKFLSGLSSILSDGKAILGYANCWSCKLPPHQNWDLGS